ncbi:MAG: sigma factor-like helix-turn-helix DNA-binding protein [Bacilli bacterium]|nr:sigma factor-like helix-turn-helix DNA-binding protein [Bacilli bacterium]
MDILEKKQHYIILFDFYGDLLTEKQRQYFKDYYFEDASLAEIANTYGISRNAIFDQLNKTYTILEDYENKLGLYKKYRERNDLYENYETKNNKEMNELINKLRNIE